MEQITEIKQIDTELLNIFPREILKKYNLLPLKLKNNEIILLSDQQPPLPVIDDLEVYSRKQIKIETITTTQIQLLINEYLDAPLETVEGMLDDMESTKLEDYTDFELNSKVENLEELASEAPIIRLVNAVITTAIKKNASDIHIEPFDDEMRIRYRIDGVLYENPSPPKSLYPAILTRIKIMANLNIAEKRLPQEGRIRIKVLGRELDIRVSIIPTLFGESVVLRLLDRAEILLELDNLGFEDEIIKEYKNLIDSPHGIILVTGPTGSGKTTTLYATLNELNTSEKKIITIEDPVEYQLDEINQIQVKPQIDFTFAEGLRAILRQDPDIIMIGEIRDAETAQIAIQAALTGHLVFATLHTNDAVSAITRLLNMGVKDYLLGATIRGVLAQRLVRRLCSECKEKYYPKPEEFAIRKHGLSFEKEIHQSVGCEKCSNIGYKGRIGIYELLTVSDEMEELIYSGASASRFKSKAEKMLLTTLIEDGIAKVKRGETSLEEVFRVTKF